MHQAGCWYGPLPDLMRGSGRIAILLPDGREQTIQAGESYTIPPGHDAWVEGGKPFVSVEVISADQFSKL